MLSLSTKSQINYRSGRVGEHSITQNSVGLDLTVTFQNGEEYAVQSHMEGAGTSSFHDFGDLENKGTMNLQIYDCY